MKKLTIVLLLASQLCSADTLDESYNECKSQLYFANGNGVFASSKIDAEKDTHGNFKKLRKLLENRNLLSNLKLRDELLEFKQSVVYAKGDENNRKDFFLSKYHLVKQLLVEHQGTYHFFSIMNYLKNNKDNSAKPAYYKGTQTQWEEVRVKYLEIVDDEIEYLLQEMSNFDVFEDPLLLEHLEHYRKSIALGNAVSTVGHSQGTLYTNFAYDVLVNENGIGSNYNVSAFGTIAERVASTENNMRNGIDAYVLDENDDSIYLSEYLFGHLPFNAKNTNPPHKEGSHVFPSYINGNNTKFKIYTMIQNQLQENIDRPSRWSILEESDTVTKKGTSAYRVKVVNGDKTVENILPFGQSEQDKIHYVSIKGTDTKMLIKGACQATSIIDHTNDTPENELIINGEKVLYELEGAEQYIFGEMTCQDPSNFEVISQANENTANWRVTVKNKETDETTEDVYPFNLNGSLYQLDNGEWVLASCGGSEILDENSSQWDDRKIGQYYKLVGTNPEEYIEAKEKEILIYYMYDEFFGADYPDFKVENSFHVNSDISEVLISMSDVKGCGYVDNGSFVYWNVAISVNEVQVITYNHSPGAHDDKTKFNNVDISDIVHAGENAITANCTNTTGKYDFIESYVFANIKVQGSIQ